MTDKEELLKSDSDNLRKELCLEAGSFGSESGLLALKQLGKKLFNVMISLKAIVLDWNDPKTLSEA